MQMMPTSLAEYEAMMRKVEWVPVLMIKIDGQLYEHSYPAMAARDDANAFARERFDADPRVVGMSTRRVMREGGAA